MIASDIPLEIGHGTAMRTFHVASELARISDLTLAIIAGDVTRPVPDALVAKCTAVLRGAPETQQPQPSRLSSWAKAGVTVLVPWRNQWSDLLALVFGQPASAAHQTPRTRRALTAILRSELSLASRYTDLVPRLSFYHRSSFKSIEPALRALLATGKVDVVWLEHAVNYPLVQRLLEAFPEIKFVCNTHNIESTLAERLEAGASNEDVAAEWRVEKRVVERAEANAFRKAGVVITCSAEDEYLVHRMVPEALVSVLPNGVDTRHFTRRAASRRSAVPTILFTGVFGYHPNLDALQYFLTDIFPIIRRVIPDCRFVFAGREAGIAASRLKLAQEGVSFISDPEDMRPLFETAWVFAVPIRIGGGTRLKILEAMSMEVPVVSTTVGAEGVPYERGEQILIGDSSPEFADQIIRLLNDASLRSRLTANAARFVREKYDWNRVVLAIEPMLNLIARPS